MKDIGKMSIQDIEAELKKRKEIEEQEKQEKALRTLPFDLERHQKFLKDIQSIVKDEIDGIGNDNKHWIYEATLEYVFGKEIWKAF